MGNRLRNLFFLLVCICLLLAGAGSAGVGSVNASTLRVGYSQGYGVVPLPDQSGYTGYTPNYLKEIARFTGWKYEFVQCEWAECLNKMRTGEIDMLGPLQYTDERAEYVGFPEHPQGYEYGALYTLSSNNRFFYNDFAGFEGMRVAVAYSTYFVESFQEFKRRNNFNVRFVFVNDVKDLLSALESGLADAFICGNVLDAPGVKVLARFAVEPFYYAVSKKSPEALVRFNEALQELRTSNVYFDAELFKRFYGDNIISRPAFTREEIDFIRSSPQYTIALDPDWSPLEYVDNEGQFSGIVPDLLRQVERNSGLRFKFVVTPSYDDALAMFKAGQVALIRQWWGEGHAESAGSTVSESLLEIPVMLISRLDTQGAGNMTIGILEGAPYFSEATALYSDAEFVTLKTSQDGINALRSGAIKAFLLNSYVFDEVVRDPTNKDLRLLSATRFTIPLRIVIGAGTDPMLLSVLNKGIARLTFEGINSSVFSNTLTPSRGLTLAAVLTEYSVPLLLVGFSLIVFVFGCILVNKHHVEHMLKDVAYTDSKTGIGNWNCLERTEIQSLFPKRCFVSMDVNSFKLLNDYFGYEAGDKALRHIAGELKRFARTGEIVVRVESDVFCMLLHTENEAEVRERLVGLTTELVKFSPLESVTGFSMSLSFGMCMCNTPDLTIPMLRDRSTVARKLFKNAYRTTYAFYDDEIHNHIMQEREIENKMVDALEHGEFQPYFQPKYDLRNDRIVGAEALVRWIPKDHGTIFPCNFIPLFERNGFIVKMDMYILECVCRHLRSWIDQGVHPVPVSVNMSKLHVLNPDFVADVLRMVDKYDISPSFIELELTETAFLENTELLLRIMNEFASKGFTLSMDDFGTGYSSLNMLQEIPVHVLKLDRAFLDMSNDSSRAKNIIAHVVHMAKDLDMQVVSEGVETVDHVRFLKHVGCDMAQGFFYSPPVPVAAFAEMAFSRHLSGAFPN